MRGYSELHLAVRCSWIHRHDSGAQAMRLAGQLSLLTTFGQDVYIYREKKN
jgi:hypothetical protein